MSQSAFVKGTFILTIAGLLSKIAGSVFRIPLQNIAGDEVLGIFSFVYPVYMVALILSVAGIPLAISKLIAEANSTNKTSTIREIFITASILALLFGVLSFMLIFGFSSSIADLLGGPETELALIIVAATLLIAPYMAVYRGFFQGFGNMEPTAVSQVIEQLVRVGLILLFAYYLVYKNASNEVIAGGVMIGSVAGAAASLLYLRVKYIRSDLKFTVTTKYSLSTFSRYSKKILTLSVPIAIGSITMALLNFVDSFTISYGLRSAGISTNDINYLYGIYGRGLSLTQIATVFASSIVLPLVPLITTKLAEKDRAGMRNVIEKAYRITHFVSWPAAIGLLALTLPLNQALFTNLEGSSMLAIINFSSVFTSLTILGTGILQGIDLFRAAALIILSGVVLKTITNISFIHFLGLDGAALSTLFVYIFLFVMNTMYIYRHHRFKLLSRETVTIIFSSLTMGVMIGLPALMIDFEHWNRTHSLLYVGIAILLGVILYLGQLLLFKVIDKNTLLNFKK